MVLFGLELVLITYLYNHITGHFLTESYDSETSIMVLD